MSDRNPLDHFECLGLPKQFSIDRSALEAAWRRLQGQFHPDRHVADSDAMRRLAAQQATLINTAVAVLRDPLQRGAYLCELHGVRSDAHGSSSTDVGFLTLQMDLREQLAEARINEDADAIESLQVEIDRQNKAYLAQLEHALDVAHDWQAGAGIVKKLMFFKRLQADVDLALEDLNH